MTQIATVERIMAGNRAEIMVARQSACAHDCHECAGCGGSPAPIRAVADNPIGAQAGQKVVVESSTRQIFGVIALVYLIPFVLFFLAYFGASALSAPGWFCIASSVFAFFCGIVPAILYDRRIRRSGGLTFTIVRSF